MDIKKVEWLRSLVRSVRRINMSFWEDLKHWFSDPCPVHNNMVTVTVHQGDCLSNIVGSMDRAHAVVAMNPDKVWDTELTVYPGEKLHIPAEWVQ